VRLRGLAALALAGALAPATVPAGATPRGPGRADPAGRALVTGPARSVPVLRDGPFGTPARRLLGDAGGSLLARHVSSRGGWAWRSAIQGGRLQTDRDVGAAGVIVGLLALREVTGDPAYLTAARRAGDWLLAVARRARGGLRWPDSAAMRGPVRLRDRFTSFDDGAPGIADALWRLWAVTGDRRYRRAALAGMRAEERLAEAPAGARCPRRYCRWPYDPGAGDETIRTGIGEGNAGIAYAYDVFAQRSGDRRFERYATSSAAYLERLITRQGAMPWAVGRRHYILGFLGGAAGDAFMFLRLYRHTGQRRWLRDARRLLGWVARRARSRRAGIDWPIFLDARRPGPAGRRAATGIEEGAAGIGWVALQAFDLTRRAAYLRMARRAGDRLLAVAVAATSPTGPAWLWPEDVGVRLFHTSLDNGAPGIAWFLDDLWRETADRRYRDAALAAARWLALVARRDAWGAYWLEYLDPRGWHLAADPSWHWGTAGIAGFLARLSGWRTDIPGEEPGLLGAE